MSLSLTCLDAAPPSWWEKFKKKIPQRLGGVSTQKITTSGQEAPPPVTPMRKGHEKTMSEDQFQKAAKVKKYRFFCAKCRNIVDVDHLCVKLT